MSIPSSPEATPQWPLLRALVERMIPRDEFPSGWEAGVGDYLNGIFASDRAADWPIVQATLDRLNAEAMAQHRSAFTSLAPELQDALLSQLESGEATPSALPWPMSPARFIRLMADLCAEGYYGDPGNGGNRDMIGWRMIGYRPGAGGDRWQR